MFPVASRCPRSVRRRRWLQLRTVPIITIRNGDGSGVLLMAGNYGNEYEGRIILMKLFQELQDNDLRGRIIVLPARNAPAVRADRRNSPLDAPRHQRHQHLINERNDEKIAIRLRSGAGRPFAGCRYGECHSQAGGPGTS
ncbi:succinylglutamate desuccinylase/aspartoacylase family protein [Bradyrhizobium sp. S3.2.12]|uniref:succinylglutamate desuccinylase/aspartoacylase domain-containing protein n=1 Tax=unclassified Bradyrhizobium TaxID=2631580 RepID=UPI0033959B67